MFVAGADEHLRALAQALASSGADGLLVRRKIDCQLFSLFAVTARA
jgi:hypothetical protein